MTNRGGFGTRHLSEVRFLESIIFLPEVYGDDARVTVFKDANLGLISYFVAIGNIDVKLRRDGIHETSVFLKDIVNPESLNMRMVRHATILAPYDGDVSAWEKYLTVKKEEFSDWLKRGHPYPRRILPD